MMKYYIGKYILITFRLCVVILQRLLYWCTFGNFPSSFTSVSVVIIEDNKILLIDRSDSLGLSLPGGFVKLFEDIEDAACREVKEETGLEIEIVEMNTILSGKRQGTKIATTEIIFEGKLISHKTPRHSFEGKCHWYELDSIQPHQIAFDHYNVIRRFKYK